MPANTHNPTQHKARPEGGSTRQERSIPPGPNELPAKASRRPDQVLVVGHTRKYTYENMFVVSQTSPGRVLVVGRKHKHKQVCSLSARTSTGQRPTHESTRTVGHSSLSAREELYYSTAPLIYFELSCHHLTVIIC